MQEKVKRMLENPGVYIAGDSNYPGVTIVLISKDGKIYSTVLDEELNPERFLNELTLKGPFLAE